MADTPKEPYPVEVSQEPEDDSGPPPAVTGKVGGEAAGRAICPECGAELDEGDDACIRCGFAPGSQPAKSAKKPTAESTLDEHAGRPISPPTRAPGFDFWLPVAIGGLALLILTVGLLAGAPGLFPQVLRGEQVEAVPWGMRFIEVLRNLVLLAFWTGCGLAGLFALSLMFERPLGEARLAAVRMAGIMATIRLAAFIAVPGPRWVEWMAEALLQAAAFVLLSMLLFRLAIRNAGILALWTLMAILLLWLFTYAVQWALGG